MDPIRSVFAKLRSLAVTVDGETARLQRALAGEESDFEDYAMRILHDLHSEAHTLKGDISILLDKASLESQESIGFIKATKVLMKKNSEDIIKIREFFQKYGYNPCAKKNPDESDKALHQYLTDPISSIDIPLKDGINRNRKGLGIKVDEQEVVDSKPESTKDEMLQKPDVKNGMSDPAALSSSASEKMPCSPQLSDFGLERYLIYQVPPIPPQAINQKKEPETLTPTSKQSLVQVLKTPKCALNMDDFECVTPKLEHFGISEYTMCLNEDYTMGLKNRKNKSAEAVETEPESSNSATIGLTNQQLEKNDAEHTKSPLAPTFCTPGLKIPSTKNRTALQGCYFEEQNMETMLMSNGRGEDNKVLSEYPLSKTNSSSNDLEMEDCTSLVLNSDKCFENCAAPSSPVISSHENLLRTPTPPKVTAIPEDVLQVLLKYNPNLAATPVAVRACHPAEHPLPDAQARMSEMSATATLVKKF